MSKICTDADLDEFPPETVDYASQIRTWGYSWESDLVDLEILRCVFVRLRGSSAKAQQALVDFEQWHATFLTSCAGYVCHDVRRVRAGAPGVFDRERPVRNYVVAAGANVQLDQGYLDERRDAHLPEGCEIPGDIIDEHVSTARHCYGKLLLKACYHSLSNFIQRVRRGRIDFDTFVDLALSCFSQGLPTNEVKRTYYDGVLPAA